MKKKADKQQYWYVQPFWLLLLVCTHVGFFLLLRLVTTANLFHLFVGVNVHFTIIFEMRRWQQRCYVLIFVWKERRKKTLIFLDCLGYNRDGNHLCRKFSNDQLCVFLLFVSSGVFIYHSSIDMDMTSLMRL